VNTYECGTDEEPQNLNPVLYFIVAKYRLDYPCNNPVICFIDFADIVRPVVGKMRDIIRGLQGFVVVSFE